MNEPGFLRCIATVEQNGRTYRGLATAALQTRSDQTDPAGPGRFRSVLGRRTKPLSPNFPLMRRSLRCPSMAMALPTATTSICRTSAWEPHPRASMAFSASRKRPANTRHSSAFPAPVSARIVALPRWQRAASSRCRWGFTASLSPWSSPFTTPLATGALANYNTFGLDNRDRYYYRRVYLGCVRANDFLTSHPKWDGVQPRRHRRQSGRSTVNSDRRAGPSCPRVSRLLPCAFRCHRVPAESCRGLAAHVPRRRWTPVAPLAGQDRNLSAITTLSTSRDVSKCPASTRGASTTRRARLPPCTRLTMSSPDARSCFWRSKPATTTSPSKSPRLRRGCKRS